MRVLEKLMSLSENNPTIKTDKENLQKLKYDSFLFNMIFKLNLEDYLNDFQILFNINENLTKNSIINILRTNLLQEEKNSINCGEDNLEIQKNKIYKAKEKLNPYEVFTESEVKILKGEASSFIFNTAIKKLFANLIKSKNFAFISIALETVFSIKKHIDVPLELVKF